MAENEELTKMGKFVLRKLKQRLGDEGGERMFRRQIKEGLPGTETWLTKQKVPSWQERVAERFREEESLGIRRGFRNVRPRPKTKK